VAEAGLDVVVIDADDGADPAGRADELATAMGGRCLHLDDLTPKTVEAAVRDLLS
jgi:Mg-chelatase subunit ChlD